MRGASCLLALGLFLVTGCSTVPWQVACKGDGWPALPGEEPKEPPKSALPILFTNGQCYRYRIIEKTPKTLLEWQLCKGDEKNDDKEQEKNGNGKNSKNSDAEKKANGEKKGDAEKKGDEKKNGNGSKKWEIEYEEPLATDFPDFGVAWVQLPACGGFHAARRSCLCQRSSKESSWRAARSRSTPSAPAYVQLRMPACLHRAPTNVLHCASTWPLPIGKPSAR